MANPSNQTLAKRKRRAKESRARMHARGYRPCPLCGTQNPPTNQCVGCGADIGKVFE